MQAIAYTRSSTVAVAGSLAVALLCLGFALGTITATESRAPTAAAGMPGWIMDAATSGKAMSMATGFIDVDVEGLFVLDHLTGNLFCWIINPRTGEVGAEYQTNVMQSLGTAGDTNVDYVMVTGRMNFSMGRTGNLRPANTVVYIGEGNSGRVVAYTLMYSRQQAAMGAAHVGELQLIAQGQTRAPALRRDP